MWVVVVNVGQITVQNSGRLDYESLRRHRLIVIATTRRHDVFDYATVWVNVVDINDNVPQFFQERYQSAVWENLPANTFVLQVCCCRVIPVNSCSCNGAVRHRQCGRRLSSRQRDFGLWRTAIRSPGLPFMVSTSIIHVLIRITTHLPSPNGWKAELVWLVDP